MVLSRIIDEFVRHAAPAALLAALLLGACAPVEPNSASPSEIVLNYYRAVNADRTSEVATLRRSLPAGTILEPIGWTASGKEFVNVISGSFDVETRQLYAPPSARRPKRRSGSLTIEIVHIRSLEVPEYFESIGAPRPGFASIRRDRIYLDHRRESDPLIFEETFEHELCHILDRPLLRTLSHEELEIRAMIRGLARGRLAELNRERLFFALEHDDAVYAGAARRILRSLALAIFGGDDLEDVKEADAISIRNAALALEAILGL